MPHTHTGRREKEPLRKSRYPEGKEVTPNFCTSSSSLLSTLLTAMFSYCSMSRATCKPQGQMEGAEGFPSPTKEAAELLSALCNIWHWLSWCKLGKEASW